MTTTLARHVAEATAAARRRAMNHPGAIARDDLPFAVLEAFDADVRGHVERDRRIEDERDRVLIAAVTFADARPDDGPGGVDRTRDRLIDAIDYLEQAVLRFGIVNAKAARLGLGVAGEPVAAKP